MEEKRDFKTWWNDKKTKVKIFCSNHPDVVLTVVGGLASLAGGALKLYANKSEYENYLYTTVDDQVYKLPAKEMKTCKKLESSDK